MPQEAGSPETTEDLEKLVNILGSISHGGQTFHFTVAGTVWVWGEVDDVVSELECIVQVFGAFELDKVATKAFTSIPLVVWKWAMSTPGHLAVYRSAPLGADVFPAVVKPLAEFLEFLEHNGKHNPVVDLYETKVQYERNDMDEVAGRTWEIKPTAPCALSPSSSPRIQRLSGRTLAAPRLLARRRRTGTGPRVCTIRVTSALSTD